MDHSCWSQIKIPSAAWSPNSEFFTEILTIAAPFSCSCPHKTIFSVIVSVISNSNQNPWKLFECNNYIHVYKKYMHMYVCTQTLTRVPASQEEGTSGVCLGDQLFWSPDSHHVSILNPWKPVSGEFPATAFSNPETWFTCQSLTSRNILITGLIAQINPKCVDK